MRALVLLALLAGGCVEANPDFSPAATGPFIATPEPPDRATASDLGGAEDLLAAPDLQRCAPYYYQCEGDNGCATNVYTDPGNCGTCGTVCQPYPHVVVECLKARCTLVRCEDGWNDCNRDTGKDGCETFGPCR